MIRDLTRVIAGRLFLGAKFTSSHATFKYPTVVLDHSMHVSSNLKGQVLTVSFEDFDVYASTTPSWTDLPMLLITSVGSDEGHFNYLLADSIDCQDVSATCMLNVTSSDFDDVTDEMLIQWGHYQELEKKAMAPWDSSQFDHHKDAQYGYYSFADGATSDLAMFAPGLTDYDPAHYVDDNVDANGLFDKDGNIKFHPELQVHDSDFFEEHAPGVRTHNQKRFLRRLGALAKQAASAIGKKAEQIGNKIKDTIKKEVVDKLIDVGMGIVNALLGAPIPLNNKFTQTIPDPNKGNVAQSTFKKPNGTPYLAKEIYKSEKKSGSATIKKMLYCLECGVTVTTQFSGELSYKIGAGVQYGHLKIDASFLAQILLGFEAGIEIEKDLMNKRIVEVGVPGLSIPNVITIGPMLTLDAKATLLASITGNLMVGGTLDIKLVHTFDLKDTQKKNTPSLTGPRFKASFNAEAEIAVGIRISVPMGLVIGLSVGNNKIIGVSAGIYSEPAIEAKASIAVKTDGQSISSGNDCKGVKVGFEVQHTLYGQVSAKLFTREMIKNGKYELHKTQKELPGSQCFPIKGLRMIRGRAVTNGTTIDISAFNDQQTFVDINDPVTHEIDTGFDEEDFPLPLAIEEFVSADGDPPQIWSDPDADPTDTSVTTFNYTLITDELRRYVSLSLINRIATYEFH